MGRRRVLIISHVIPPLFMAGTPRLLRWCEILPGLGWDVSLLGVDDDPMYRPLAEVPEGVQRFPVKIAPSVARRAAGKIGRMLGAAKPLEPWPDHVSPCLPRLLAEVTRAKSAGAFDTVMVTVPSFSLTEPAFITELGRLFSGRLVLDVRDAFSDNEIMCDTPARKAIAVRMQAAAAAASSAVIHVTPRFQELSAQWYPGVEAHCIPNGFSWRRFEGARDPSPWPGRIDGVFRLAYTGMAYRTHAPRLLIPGLVEACRMRPGMAAALRFRFHGAYETEALGDWSALPGVLEKGDPIPFADVPKVLCSADVLCVVSSETVEAGGIAGGKIYDYLGARRPVLAAVTTAAAGIVRETRCGLVCDPNRPDEIAAAVVELFDQWKRNEPFPLGGDERCEQWEAGTLGRKLADVLSAVSDAAAQGRAMGATTKGSE
jgi:glycosyltransferase involved in cell wall biosynthesis